ncbi:hypothetical protein Trydic_g18388 [Trypoxylus dichotomus]
MRLYLCISSIVILLYNGWAILDEEGCYDTIHGLCLDYNFRVIPCIHSRSCHFIFHCPHNFTPRNRRCYYDSIYYQCPNLSQLNYSVEYNEEYRLWREVVDYDQADYLTRPSKNSTCAFYAKDLCSLGDRVNTFQLQFDEVMGEVILIVDSNIGLEYIKCYARDFFQDEEIGIYKKISTGGKHRIYHLNITQQPNIYFCVILAPTKFALNKTNEVVGYSDIPGNKYIAKFSLMNNNLTELRQADWLISGACAREFVVCKLMEKQNYIIFYYIQDLLWQDFADIEIVVESIRFRLDNPTLHYIRRIDRCIANTTFNGEILNWESAEVGTTIKSSQLCLDEDGMQVTRRCEGDFFTGAHWSEPSGNCSNNSNIPEKTYRLHQLLNEQSITEVLTNITRETDDFTQITSVDVNLLSDGLETMSTTSNATPFSEDFFYIINNIMQSNSTVLRNSQEQLNSTDKILDSIESFVLNMAESTVNLSTTIVDNLLTHISYPFLSNVIGLAIYNDGQSGFSNYRIVNLYWNQTFRDLNLEDLELAVYIPTKYIQDLTESIENEEKTNFKIISTIFYNDGFFNDLTNKNHLAGSRVIDVNIPTMKDSSNIPVYLLFRPVLNFNDPNCAFWDYGRHKHGKWSTSGGEYMGLYHDQSLMHCAFNHVTHFALLVLNENIRTTKRSSDVDTIHDLLLTIITLVGCTLSLVGLVIILLTTLFKDWYKRRLNTIQLAVAMLIEIIALYVADLNISKGSVCLAVGAVLHYIVIAKFVWMLIIARIQYLKFVKVFDGLQSKSYTITHALLGWIVPIIPVTLGLVIFPDSYQSGHYNICYVKDYNLYFFVILPISVIILVNIQVFSVILLTVSRSKARDYGIDIQQIQIRLAIMLLFMLGITWIFGLIGELLPWGWFKLASLYIFCLLGSVQGFVLFIFTVVLDRATVTLWVNLYKFKPGRYGYYEVSAKSKTSTQNSGDISLTYLQQHDDIL